MPPKEESFSLQLEEDLLSIYFKKNNERLYLERE